MSSLPEYMRLLKTLHFAILYGGGDSEKADNIHEQMDILWKDLSGEEILQLDKYYESHHKGLKNE
jgi:hypothetical protein